MSTIRPLATIAVLAALGVFLALKINEGGGPVALNQDWQEAPAANLDDAPTFEASDTSLSARSAPVEAAPFESAAPKAAPTFKPDTPGLPDLPPMPSMPAMEISPVKPASANAEAPALRAPPTASTNTATDPVLSEVVPLVPPAEQQQTAVKELPTTTPEPTITGRVPSLGTSIQSQDPISVTGAGLDFATAWPQIQTALQRDDLAQAHLKLSQLRNTPNLDSAQKQQIDQLLGQLAGTVVYSLEHRLEPPHQVKPGETLVTIAQQYNVPWQLLAKINGVASPAELKSGQTIKVIRGPFSAEVQLGSSELVLLIDGRYAGKFTVLLDGQATQEGQWTVAEKPTQLAAPTVVLRSEKAAGQEIVLTPTPGSFSTAGGRIAVASRDATDIYDILSVGSKVTIRR